MQTDPGRRAWWLIVAMAAGCAATDPGNGAGGGGDDDDSGEKGAECSAGETRCSDQAFQECSGGGFVDREACAGETPVCNGTLGCVACDPALASVCVGDEVHDCAPDGTVGALTQRCDAGATCRGGACSDACSDAAASRSYLGCEYWAVDLDNAVDVASPDFLGFCSEPATLQTMDVCEDAETGLLFGLCDFGRDCSATGGAACVTRDLCAVDAQHSPFAIVVSNPDPLHPVQVTLSNAAGRTYVTTVLPGAVVPIFPQQVGFPDQSLDFSGIEAKAYRVTSSRPIVAYQFNPLDNVDVFSNDASLLLPTPTLDTSYFVLGAPSLRRRPSAQDLSAYATVVATLPGATTVQVTARAAIRAGLNVPRLPAGMTQTFTLQQFETLNLEAESGGDLSGTFISGDQPFSAFSGHEAQMWGAVDRPCCADHLEDQLFPASTWGKVYALARSLPRAGEPDRVRVLAQHPGTTVTFDPPASEACGLLGPGDFCDVLISGDTEIVSNEPVLVAHYLMAIGSGGDFFGDGAAPAVGDPSLAFAVPTEQFRTDYTVLVPAAYDRNFFSLVAAGTGPVELDGVDVSGMLAPFGSGLLRGGRVMVSTGQHQLSCAEGCGIEVGGYGDAVSYLFAGGLDLDQIVIN